MRTIIAEKPDDIRDLGPVRHEEIAARLARLADNAWRYADDRKENKFFCFQNTRHIIHRFTPSNKDVREHYETPAWLIWRDLLEPVMERVTRRYGYAARGYPKAMFARLAAGGVIDRHVDGAGSNLQAHKIHVPIETNPGAVFFVNDKEFHLEAGRAYEVNNIVHHGAENRGETDRIHFIFEVYDASDDSMAAAS